ncbi:Nitric oxide dioxygenase [Purpureocillium takamizusanense]|uniref:nitric oxide dioxygenase n=1 Tax=Purpureocillium takamizusanense TaxID=2060973 RepID=A0A9Q8QEG3_9HYPO|nr:Nitric oxide dioxygenase [Purpureocillium takamizusanense]UNI18458.1 Nitric oxide dioxygenase [Purpureocillium takamizusanense]
MALTYKESQKIRATIPALQEHGELLVTVFYRNLLHNHPELKNLFNTANQVNGFQPRALASIILQFAKNINHIYELVPKLERICQKHCSLGVQPEHYSILGKHLIEAFSQVLGPQMTPEALQAWKRAYSILANMLIGREKQLYGSWGRWTGWRQFRVVERVPENPDICSFLLSPVDEQNLPGFMPGQYISVRVDVPGKNYKQIRQYSLSDSPRPGHYRITVKRDDGTKRKPSTASHCPYANTPGVVSNQLLDSLFAGDTIEASHPTGQFYLDTNNLSSEPVVLISAGIGATPVLSILNYIIENQPTRPVSWVHGARSDMPFHAHIAKLQKERPNFHSKVFKTHLADADLAGVTYDYDYRLDLATLSPDDLCLTRSSAEYYVCGPEQFMLETADFLESQHVDPTRIKYELFATGERAASPS